LAGFQVWPQRQKQHPKTEHFHFGATKPINEIASFSSSCYYLNDVRAIKQDAAEGRVISHEELKKRIAKWRKSTGR